MGTQVELGAGDLRRRLREYSTGMKRKLGIVQAFQADPALLVLDEPTEGLDPLMQEVFYDLVAETRRRGRTIFMSSHVLPEVEDFDVDVKNEDLRIETMRAQGAGGQHVNKTESAIRITHIPTGIVVMMQDSRSQHKNRASAMNILRSRIYDAERQRVDAARSADRKEKVGSGDRSERIRTYNFPQGRVTDHRINLTLYKLPQVIAGESLGDLKRQSFTEVWEGPAYRRLRWELVPPGDHPLPVDHVDAAGGDQRGPEQRPGVREVAEPQEPDDRRPDQLGVGQGGERRCRRLAEGAGRPARVRVRARPRLLRALDRGGRRGGKGRS